MSYLTFDPKSLFQNSPYVILLSWLGLSTLRYAFILIQLHLPHHWLLLLHHASWPFEWDLQPSKTSQPSALVLYIPTSLDPQAMSFLLPTTPAESIIVPWWTEIPLPHLLPLRKPHWIKTDWNQGLVQQMELWQSASAVLYSVDNYICKPLWSSFLYPQFSVCIYSVILLMFCCVKKTVTKLCRYRLGKWPWTFLYIRGYQEDERGTGCLNWWSGASGSISAQHEEVCVWESVPAETQQHLTCRTQPIPALWANHIWKCLQTCLRRQLQQRIFVEFDCRRRQGSPWHVQGTYIKPLSQAGLLDATDFRDHVYQYQHTTVFWLTQYVLLFALLPMCFVISLPQLCIMFCFDLLNINHSLSLSCSITVSACTFHITPLHRLAASNSLPDQALSCHLLLWNGLYLLSYCWS